MNHKTLKEAFMQVEENEAADLFNEMMRQATWAALFEMIADEVERLCGSRYLPDPDGAFHREGSEKRDSLS